MTYGCLAFRRIYDQITTWDLEQKIWWERKREVEKNSIKHESNYKCSVFALFIMIQFTTSLNCEPSLYFLPTRGTVLKRRKSRSAWSTVRWFHLVPILRTIPLSRTRLASLFPGCGGLLLKYLRAIARIYSTNLTLHYHASLAYKSAAHSYELARKMKVYSMARDFFSDARNDLSSSFPLFEKRVD